MAKKNILNDLNESQRVAVECTEGPVMVIAGAGSGKTRVLTYRIAHLLDLGSDPFNILALTFTNKAAREMKDRIIELAGGTEAHNLWMGTFHSIFARILRIEGHFLGYPSNYTIYDTEDTKRIIKAIIRDQNLDDKVYQPGYILHRISAAKTSLISAAEYNSNPELREYDNSSGKPKTGELYTVYQSRLFRASAMDFDDLLFNMNILLRDYPDVLYKYQQKFRYILVDEYQDTNYAQYLILKQLAANNENICVVGDDAQSIYGFRGANIQNIMNFKTDYAGYALFKLEQNYRSTKTIVAVANRVIENNKNQIFKEIWTDNEEGAKINLIRSATDNEEGNIVAQSIFEYKMNNQLPNASFAVLYRTNAQSRALEEALRRLNIPCRIYGGLSFYQRKEVKDLLAYFRVVINNRDDDALLRIINYPARGIGKTTIEKLVVASDQYKVSLLEMLGNPAQFPLQVTPSAQQKLAEFLTMIKSFSVMLKTKNAFELARHIAMSSGILRELDEDKTPEGVSRYENIEELLNAIKESTENNEKKSLADFMQEVALITDLDYNEDGNNDRVTLMTIHSAKGLEFPFVFIVGLEENLFPSIQSLNSRADLEEERRLFYVAITRAQKRLSLSFAENRYRWGTPVACEPSRFLDEIPEEYIDFPKRFSIRNDTFLTPDNFSATLAGLNSFPKKPVNLKNFQRLSKIDTRRDENQGNDQDIYPGMEVEHDRFGKGKVIGLEGSGANKKATVFFPGIGQKQLLLRFARLRIL